MKNINILKITIFVFLLLSMGKMGFCANASDSQKSYDDGLRLVFSQHAYEEEARSLERAYKYDEAIMKYRKAMEIEEKRPRVFRGGINFDIARILQNQGKYQEALDLLNNNPYRNPKHEYGNDRIDELKALVEYQKTGEPKAVYNYLNSYMEKYKKGFPPNGHGVTCITTVLRLYDAIGDHESGINYIDVILNWTYETDKEFKTVKHVKTSQEATELMQENLPKRDRDPNWKAYRWIREYLLVREAFEQDKRDGTKGRATKALIQSDYFPW